MCLLAYFDEPLNFQLYDAKEMPCLFINLSEYSKDRVSRYIDEFIERMTGSREYISCFYCFKNGKFGRNTDRLE